MKNINVIILVFLLCTTLSACGNVSQEKKDKVGKLDKTESTLIATDTVLEDFVIALETRWDLNSSTVDTPEIEKYDNYNKCVESELKIMEKYRNKEFKDEKLGESIKKYIIALDRQKEAYDYKDDSEKYKKIWGEGYDARREYLKQINENYDLVGKFTDSKYVKEFESMTRVYTQISPEKITNTDWVGIWGTQPIGNVAFGFHIDAIDEETKTCEVWVYATDEYNVDSAPVKGIILDNERLYFAFENSANSSDDSYTAKFIVEVDETLEEGYKLTIDWEQMNATIDENVYEFIAVMNRNKLNSIGLYREY